MTELQEAINELKEVSSQIKALQKRSYELELKIGRLVLADRGAKMDEVTE